MNTSQIFGTFLKLVLRQGSDLDLGLGSFLKLMLELAQNTAQANQSF
jgi:hypothetical protein